MAVPKTQSLREMAPSRECDKQAGREERILIFRVPGRDASVVANNCGYTIGQAWQDDPSGLFYISRIQARRVGDEDECELLVTVTSETFGWGSDTNTARVRRTTIRRDKRIYTDVDGNEVADREGLIVSERIPAIEIVGYTVSPPTPAVHGLVDKTNSDTFLGWAPNTLLLDEFQTEWTLGGMHEWHMLFLADPTKTHRVDNEWRDLKGVTQKGGHVTYVNEAGAEVTLVANLPTTLKVKESANFSEVLCNVPFFQWLFGLQGTYNAI